MKIKITEYAGSKESQAELQKQVEAIFSAFGSGDLEVTFTRTNQQNNALHLWLKQLAEIMNDAGYDQRKTFDKMKKGYDLPWSCDTVKANLYKPIMAAMTGKRSTAEMDKVEPSVVCDVLGRWASENLGITPPPWPSRESQMRAGQ